jgi:AraC-like DNA-binding protein
MESGGAPLDAKLSTQVAPVPTVRERAFADDYPWRQRVGGFSALPALIRQLGGDPGAILGACGLTLDDFAEKERRVPFSAIARALHEAAATTGTPHFGLLAGRAWHLEGGGPVSELVRHSPTLGDALRTFVAHQRLYSEAGTTFLIARSGIADFGYALYRSGGGGAAEVYDTAAAIGMNYLRELLGPGWQPLEVLLPRAAPADVSHYRALFRVPPRFDSEFMAIRFPESLLEREIEGADRERWRRAADAVAQIERTTPFDLVQRVFRALRAQLLAGGSSGDSVAQALGLHRRTLNRRLREEGTTFQRCLDQLRFEVACQLLTETRVSLDDIAATLGYASVSPFMRTFRRWSGTTPAQWRRAAGHAETRARPAHRPSQVPVDPNA